MYKLYFNAISYVIKIGDLSIKMENEFNKTLGNFISDFASGGAVKHYCDLYYTVDEIAKKLNYPLSKDKIAKMVFDYYVECGIVCLKEPKNTIEKVSFVKEQSLLGKNSLRKVVETIPLDTRDYTKCDFGKQLYKNKCIKFNANTSVRLEQHLNELPWPLTDVWLKKSYFLNF